jgi:CMP-2-keto-3-deoxyoctulosonic acid synthetase
MLHEIVIATSTNPRDDAIESFCRDEGIEIVRGPEDDVLARFHLAAEKYNADVIVRVSSDAPFLDPAFIDHQIFALGQPQARQIGVAELLPEIVRSDFGFGVEGHQPFAFDIVMNGRHHAAGVLA